MCNITESGISVKLVHCECIQAAITVTHVDQTTAVYMCVSAVGKSQLTTVEYYNRNAWTEPAAEWFTNADALTLVHQQ
jgi:hypothetical protein